MEESFDTIPHDDLLRSVARRISDRKMLRLIKMWLKTPVEERDDQGRRRRTGGKKHRQGIPQGGVISPLLANVYIRRLLICWAQWGLEEKLRARIVNYADDFVIVCRGTAPEALAAARTILGKMGLELSQEKTRVTNAWREPFDSLGCTFGVCHSRDNGRRHLGARPSERARKRLYGRVRHVLHRGNMQPRERGIR
jgi:RNA-directed DNA polymerase